MGLLGAGRVGTAVGERLDRLGHRVRARTVRAHHSTARRLPDAVACSVPEVAARAELLILGVPDPDIPAVVAELADSDLTGRIVAHTAGALGVSVLAPLATAGAEVLALHPAQTFTGADDDTDRLAGIAWAITARTPVGSAVGQALVLELGGTPIVVREEERTRYHAALAHGANHLVTLLADAADMLEGIAAAPAEARAILRPLAEAALRNVLADGDAALTGPLARGDEDTVARHDEALAEHDAQSGLDAAQGLARAYSLGATATRQRLARQRRAPEEKR